jgi:import inner membrane translocase subunit TIM22
MNNCFVKGALSGLMGGVAGFAFGIFSASLDNAGAGVGVAPPC